MRSERANGRWLRLAWSGAVVAGLAACGGDDGPPPFEGIERVVVIGDSATTSPYYATSAPALLFDNDDERFPELAGADVSARFPGARLVRLDHGGDSYHALAQLPQPVCACAGAACPADGGYPCVDTGVDAYTLVVVQLGINDVLDMLVQLFRDTTLQADPQPMFDAFRDQVRLVLAAAGDPATMSAPPLIAVLDPFDPADGQGDLLAIAEMFYPLISPTALPMELVDRLVDEVRSILREEAEAAGAVFVDISGTFSGHGYHAASPEQRWLQTMFETNARGAHELRRALWNALSGDAITAGPGPLADAGDPLAIPEVPDIGWANAVVDSEITQETEVLDLNPLPNLSADPAVAIGPPGTGNSASVAIGLAGTYIVLDLGEGEEATDGDGLDLLVLENGALTGGAPEPYRVLVSDAPDGPFIPLADARGERAFDLGAAGVTRARYVKIVSQAHHPDVISGLGSPLYPGPEIDAVGAVYPGGP